MIWGLEHQSYKQRLRHVFNLEKGRFHWSGVLQMCVNAGWATTKDQNQSLPVVSSEWTAGNGHKLQYKKFHLNIRESFLVKVEEVALKGHGVSPSLEIFQT